MSARSSSTGSEEVVPEQPTPVSPPAAYCDHCGEPVDARDHTACLDLRQLEPPRYCPLCRRRMIVQVVPRGWSARCSAHGDIV
jgi:hypothetical protein